MKGKIHRYPLRELIHRDLVEQIRRGDFSPGSRLKDTELAATMEVSRTPVREALLRLVKEGFLENQVGKGFVVKSLTEKEVSEIYPIIKTLESLALKSSGMITKESLSSFEKINSEMQDPQTDFIRLIELDMEWHNTLLMVCKNDRLLNMITDLKGLVFRYECAFMQDRKLVQHSLKEHRRIVDTIFKEGPGMAAMILEEHWDSSKNALLKRLNA
jgi:DNA-binding GntR family transcriptional regulator